MKILIVTSLLPDQHATSGGAIVMHGIVRAAATRHHVVLACFSWNGVSDRDAIHALEGLGVDVHVVAGRWKSVARLAPLWLQTGYPFRCVRFIDPAMQSLLDCLIISARPDVVQIEDNAMATYRYRTSAPRLLTEHEVRVSVGSRRTTRWPAEHIFSPIERIEQRRWQAFQHATWRAFDRVQAFTESDAVAMTGGDPVLTSRVRVNPFGVDVKGPTGLRPLDESSLVFVGQFMHRPNVDAALWLGRDIMPLILARCPEATLKIVGSCPPREVQALQSHHIDVTGHVPRVEPFLEEASVVLAPVRQGGGMRVKVLQAMALGKAVVTTPLGASGVAVGDCAPPLIVAESAEEIADGAVRSLRDTTEREALGARAREFVLQHHSWPAFASRQERIYRELVEVGGVRGSERVRAESGAMT